MSAFIIIGTDSRLSSLVDGIEKNLPLNPNVETFLSTGKIERRNDGVIYKYRINGESKENEEPATLSDLVRNQLAAFRKAYDVSEFLNIFTLENPMSDVEFQDLNGWMREFEEVFRQDSNIHIHRILFSYNLREPCDVVQQLSPSILTQYLGSRNGYKFEESSSVLYISNRDACGAAVFLGTKEHDFKLSRLLADLMMIFSSDEAAYKVFGATTPSSSIGCYSLGYAESMYYFPDVKEYYEHADMRSLYEHILGGEDEAAELQDNRAMDIEKHPLGLNKRKERLKSKYESVPFDYDVKLCEGTADFIIDDCLMKLKDLYCKKREEEIKKKRCEVEGKIEALSVSYDSLEQGDCESDEEFNGRKKVKFEEKEQREKELQNELNRFIKEFPEFTCRERIFDHFGGYKDQIERENYLKNAEEQYNKFVAYATGNDFLDYVKGYDESHNTQQASLPNNPGCWQKFWKRKPKSHENVPIPTLMVPLLDTVKEIREQLERKKGYEIFRSKCSEVEEMMRSEREYCNRFKLTDHSHHYYHLIDLPKLKECQEGEFDKRFEQILQQWTKGGDRTLSQLKELLHRSTEDCTNRFKYIDWNKRFPFVSDIDSRLVEVRDKLCHMSSPFVHEETIKATARNNVIRTLFSDIPDIEKKFDNFKDNGTNGDTILPHHSTHIASKLCFFQFMPLDEESLRNVCELI